MILLTPSTCSALQIWQLKKWSTSIWYVQSDVSTSIKSKLLNSLPRKQSDTANLAKEVELAVGMKYDPSANIGVTDGLTNGSSCELKIRK